MEVIIQGRSLVPGTAEGIALVGTEPLSFWGGYDQHTGEIIDRRHALSGKNARHRILAIPGTRGSSTTTAVLLEAVHRGTAPAALLTVGADTFLSLAAIVADELFGSVLPVVALSQHDFALMKSGQHISIRPDGQVLIAD